MKKFLLLLFLTSLTPTVNMLASITTEASIKTKATVSHKKTKGVHGTYYCGRTHEYYVFNNNHTGKFVTGGVTSNFRWQLKGSFVYVTYSNGGGTTSLQYNRSKNYLLESSSIYGTLCYEKTTSL